MRKFGWFITCSILILGSVTLVDGQFQFQPGKGGFGGIGQDTPLTVLNRSDVKKELDVTEEQMEKLPAELLVAISKILNEKQYKRFRQIELQKRGNDAFIDPTVQTALNVTAEQKTNIKSLIDDSKKEIADAAPKFGGFGKGKGGGGGDFKAALEKQDNIRKETKTKIYETILSKTQRKAWKELVGDEFKFTQQGLGGGKKKKDAE